jgi:hypothetical protein
MKEKDAAARGIEIWQHRGGPQTTNHPVSFIVFLPFIFSEN